MHNSTSSPFFSVIIATYNRVRFLPIAVESVLNQSFTEFELLIVDDGSTDNTKKMVERYIRPKSQDPRHKTRIRYICQKNQGVSAARNRGVKEAEGEFVCFLDSDDRFRQNKLDVTNQYIKKYPEYKIFHTDEVWYRNGQILPPKGHHQKPNGSVFSQALKLCCISISTVAIRREIFNDVGYFDENLPACEDYDFWLRASAKYPVLLIPEHLTIKEGGHSDQQSKKYPAMDKFRIYALEKLLHSVALTQEQYSLAYEELKAKCAIYRQGALKRNKTQEAEYCRKILQKLKHSHE